MAVALAPSVIPTPMMLAAILTVLVATLFCLLLPLDRRVVFVLFAAELAVAWCWFVMLERSTIPIPDSFDLTGAVSSLTEQKGTNQLVNVAVESSSAAALANQNVSITFSDTSELMPGQRVTCHCRVFNFPNQTKSEWLNQLEQNKISLRSNGPLILGEVENSPRWWLLHLRAWIVERSDELWHAPQSSLAAGLIVGSREQFSVALTTAMQRTGTTHLVAVSGENVVVIMWIFGVLMPRRRPWLRAGLLGLVLLAFALLTGGTASVTRAGLVAFILLLARGFGRPTSSLRLLLIVAAIIAVFDPLVVVANLGFQLSFLAVFGLIVFAEPLTNLLHLPRWLGVPLATTLAASLCTAPLLAASFGIVSIISPLTNLVLVAVVNPAMLLAIGAVVGSIIPLLGQFIAWLTWPFLGFVTNVISLASRIPGASLSVQFPVWGAWISIVVIGVFGYWLDYRKRKKALS